MGQALPLERCGQYLLGPSSGSGSDAELEQRAQVTPADRIHAVPGVSALERIGPDRIHYLSFFFNRLHLSPFVYLLTYLFREVPLLKPQGLKANSRLLVDVGKKP